MSRRERFLMTVGVLVAIGLVAYPLAYRIGTEGARATAVAPATPRILAVPTVRPASVPPTIAPSPFAEIPFVLPERSIDPAWQAEASAHRGANGKTFTYQCPSNGTFGRIWGTDTYTDDSSVCTAGVHQGVITREKGGKVTIIIRKALTSYEGSTRNGVTSESYDFWDGSYQVVTP